MGKAVVGEILSWGNPGDLVWVKANGRCFQATAATEINSGIASITIDEQGQAWAWCATHPQVSRTRTLEFTKIDPPTPVEELPGPIKVLFYLQTEQGYDLYIGGDRLTPVRIFSSFTLPTAYLSNTGRRLNDWVVGVKEPNRVLNIYPGDRVFACSHPAAPFLEWKGSGFWTYSFSAEATSFFRANVQRQETRSGNQVSWNESWELVPGYPSPLVNGSGSGSSSGTAEIDLLT